MGMKKLSQRVHAGATKLGNSLKGINRGGLPGGKQTGPNAFGHLKRGTGMGAGGKLKKR